MRQRARGNRLRRGVGLTVLAGLLIAIPTPAFAHGIGGRLDLPVPVSYFVVAAAVALVVSFVALAFMWPTPRLQDGPRTEPARMRVSPRGVLPALGVLGLMLVLGQLVPALFGLEVDSGRPTIAPVLVWVVFWLIVPFAGALIGDWYTDLNPWRTLGRVYRIGRGERLWLLERVGIWPAIAAFFAFTWFELVYPDSSSPTMLATAALVYTVFLLVAMFFAGRETGLGVFDAFTPYNRLISAISPVGRREDGQLIWRGWLRSLTVIPHWPGLPWFVATAIGTVTFDGLSATSWYRETFGEFGQSLLGGTALLLGSVLAIGGTYYLASWMAAWLGGGALTVTHVAYRFAHSLVPIALAYAVAHYVTLIIFEGQQLIAAISDPFALGWDIFGTADRKVDFFLTASEPVWYFQVGVIILGHVLGVVLAHDRALADFGEDAVRSQYAMLLLMVALTSLGLLILSG